MDYAIVLINKKQYQVAEGGKLLVEKIEGKKNKKLNFDQVLFAKKGDQTWVGEPHLKGAQVEAKILEQTKGEKIRVATYRAKSRSRKVKGHRQKLTVIKIEKITFPKGK